MKKSIKELLFYLKVSRPGLWFATIWLYLLPTSQSTDLLYTTNFWVGFFYVCFPLNFLVYGWNDIVDYDTDLINPRKNSFWFGARGSKQQLNKLWKPILLIQLISIPILVLISNLYIALVFMGFIIINALYNLPKNGLRSKPPLELICQIGYLLIIPMSIIINQTDNLVWQTYFYLFLFSIQSHLMGEVMDIEPDQKSGRRTTATILGMAKTKLLIIAIMAAEIFIIMAYFKEYIFGSILALGLLWIIVDIILVFKNKTYTMFQMKLFAVSSNIIAFSTIVYVWYSGCLLSIK